MDMKLLLIRHGKTFDRPKWQKEYKNLPDSERPMTRKGKVEFSLFAKHLRHTITDIDIIWSSPLVRTMQTAEILSKEYKNAQIEQQSVLMHDGKWSALKKLLLEDYKNKRTIALVGHDSHLTYVCSKLMGYPKKDEIIIFKKGACALFDVQKTEDDLHGVLEAFIRPDFLINLGKKP